jgi:hypothetical protein
MDRKNPEIVSTTAVPSSRVTREKGRSLAFHLLYQTADNLSSQHFARTLCVARSSRPANPILHFGTIELNGEGSSRSTLKVAPRNKVGSRIHSKADKECTELLSGFDSPVARPCVNRWRMALQDPANDLCIACWYQLGGGPSHFYVGASELSDLPSSFRRPPSYGLDCFCLFEGYR